MRSSFFRPDGKGPFPLAIINHGSDESEKQRRRAAPPAFDELTGWLVRRGYAVLVPQRPGHGATGGPYLESQGRCSSPDYVAAGNGAAASIRAAIAFMRTQPVVRPHGMLVIGNSAGGWGAVALGAANPPGVAAIVSFAGGRGGRDRGRPNFNCAPDRLVEAAGDFGRSSRLPSLWLYAANDSFFAPDLASDMASAFAASGGNLTFEVLSQIDGDGHALINRSGTATGWEPILDAFLERLN